MDKYFNRLKKIKTLMTKFNKENFLPVSSGTRFKVFISDNYVVRFRDDEPELLRREANLLQKLNGNLFLK